MYLTYDEFVNMGGTLDKTAFNQLSRKSEYLINAQGNGKTGERINQLSPLPQAVKDCTFDLIMHLSENKFDGSKVQSESQSLGGQSESFSYATLNKSEATEETNNIIFDYLYSVKIDGISILYLGANV